MIGMLFFGKMFYNNSITYKQIVVAALVPFFVLLLLYIFIFGFQNLLDIATYQIERHLINKRAEYHLKDKNGPWFQYIVDFFILSPTTSILFFLGVGYLFATDKINLSSRQNMTLLFLLFFFIYAFGVFALLIKHVRYAIFLGVVYRFFVVLFIINLIQKYITDKGWSLYTLALVMLIVIGLDLKSYQRLF